MKETGSRGSQVSRRRKKNSRWASLLHEKHACEGKKGDCWGWWAVRGRGPSCWELACAGLFGPDLRLLGWPDLCGPSAILGLQIGMKWALNLGSNRP